MKPAPFAFDAPTTVAEAIELLATHGDEAKLIAGGQSLVPLLALRFAQPPRLIDLNRIDGLAGIRPLDDGGLAIGATTRTQELVGSPLVAARAPLAAHAAPLIAHRQIRNLGTVGGSVAHADAAAELPAVMLALGATIVAQGPGGTREIAAAGFFQGYYTTALADDELVVELRMPAPAARSGSSFLEVSRRRGDFAMVGVAAAVTLDAGDAVADVRLALIGVADRPFDASDAAAELRGCGLDAAGARRAGAAAAELVTPPEDIHGSSAYRRQLVRVLVERALLEAAGRAAAAAAA